MSSTNKTAKLGLNKWLGTDVPKREDFVKDNELIDNAVGTHLADNIRHVTSNDKTKWNQPYYITVFNGDGNATRTVQTDCPFNPTWGIIFANALPPSAIDIANEGNYNYFSIFTKSGNIAGASIVDGNKIKVVQSSNPVLGHEYRSFNQLGTTYIMILFR